MSDNRTYVEQATDAVKSAAGYVQDTGEPPPIAALVSGRRSRLNSDCVHPSERKPQVHAMRCLVGDWLCTASGCPDGCYPGATPGPSMLRPFSNSECSRSSHSWLLAAVANPPGRPLRVAASVLSRFRCHQLSACDRPGLS